MKIEKKFLKDLKPAEYNPRQANAKQQKNLADSLKKFGVVEPIIININQDRKNIIIGGHFRVRELIKLGYKEVDCVIVDLSLEDEKELNIRLNANTGEWDISLLNEFFDNDDLLEWGLELNDDEISIDESKETMNDDDVPNVANNITQKGDLYELNNHRLLCGDATIFDNVEKLMNNELADLIHSDPPYNVNVSNSQGMIIKNDNMSKDEFRQFIRDVYSNMFLASKKGASAYIYHSESERATFTDEFINCGFKLAQILIWVKSHFTLSRQDYNWRHEPILYGWKEGAGHYFCEDYTQDTIIDKQRDEIKNMEKNQLITLIQNLMNNTNDSIIYHNKTLHNELHPTMKPVELCERLIKNSSKINNIVIDFFAGSGSTLIACEKLKRKCFLLELDEKYCDVVVKRYINFCISNNIDLSIKRNGFDCIKDFT